MAASYLSRGHTTIKKLSSRVVLFTSRENLDSVLEV